MAACPPQWPWPRACCRRRHDAVQVFKAWLAAATCDRDLSHAMQHFERVETLAVCLARAEPDFPAADLPVLRLAALAHDVLDHKYVSAAEAPRLEGEMRRVLGRDCGLAPEDVARVLLVAGNISLSLEKENRLDWRGLRAHRCEHLRALVSDADKLEALGGRGLQRLLMYQASLGRVYDHGYTLPMLEEVRALAAQHILPRADWLCTETAQRLKPELHRELQAILQDDERLYAFCRATLELLDQGA